MKEDAQLAVFGTSGHARDVVNVARLAGFRRIVLVARSADAERGFLGLEVIAESDDLAMKLRDFSAIVAIGDNRTRARVMDTYPNLRYVNVVAPTASVGFDVELGRGVFVGHHAYIGPNTQIDDGVIINASSLIGHDCRVGAFAQVSPRACVLGHVDLGRCVSVGAGAIIIDGPPSDPLRIADNVVIGMGVLVSQSIRAQGITLIAKPNAIALG